DMMGPRYVLGQAGAKVQLIALHPGNIKTVMGVQVVPDNVIDSVNQLDILVIPGGFTGTSCTPMTVLIFPGWSAINCTFAPT
ncbi:MAG: DJ-1/PfpI family protein, partial [Flammeovirgaceae bacterium]